LSIIALCAAACLDFERQKPVVTLTARHRPAKIELNDLQ
jgi:hypothetical protein